MFYRLLVLVLKKAMPEMGQYRGIFYTSLLVEIMFF